MNFQSIMDYMQALFSFFIAPLFATLLLGMFWRRTTRPAGFWGLLCGMSTAVGIFLATRFGLLDPRYVTLSDTASDMALNMWQAAWSFVVNFTVTVVVSLFTKPRPIEELAGVVYGVSAVPHEGPSRWYRRPAFWAGVSLAIFVALNIMFW
jgi:SSS family solute:Na+ symporter